MEALGWQSYARPDDPFHVTIPPVSLAALAKQIQTKLKANTMRVVGNPNLLITHVALVPGAAGLETQVKALRSEAVELLIAGEASEWETVEYVRDASAQGRHKALILLGHEVSEDRGWKVHGRMAHCVSAMKVEHIPAGDPMWLPGELRRDITGEPSMKALLTETAERATRYLEGIADRRVAPLPEDVARLEALGGPLPESPSEPARGFGFAG